MTRWLAATAASHRGRLPREGSNGSLARVTPGQERSRWKVRGDRVIDENRLMRLSQASVELPDGTRFDQYVMRFAPGAMTVVLDEARSGCC